MVFSLAARSAGTGALRTAARPAVARPAALPAAMTLGRRGYAEAVSDKLKLSFILPHAAIYESQEVTQVNVSAESGEMGILAHHVPSVEELKPGVLEVQEASGSKRWFVSGGFATMHPNNRLTVNAIEAYPIEDFSPENVRNALAEAQRVASGNASAERKAEAEIEVEVLTALQASLTRA